MGTPTIRDAQAYAFRGWTVFPCGRDKKPLTRHGFKDATKDAGQVWQLWSKHNGANIGIPTGPDNGFFVLDVDLPEGPATLAQLEEEHGKLPVTLEQATGGGGRQLFFRYPKGRKVPNSAGKLGPGLDVRGEGGYVIAPPSIHESGRNYQWKDKHTPIAEAPEPWLEMVCARPEQPPSEKPVSAAKTSGARENMRPEGTTPYGLAALEAEARKIAETPAGERNHALFKGTAAIAELAAGGEVDPSEAEAVLTDAGIRAGLNPAETRKTVSSGMKAGERRPRQAPVTDNAFSPREQPAPKPVPFDSWTPPAIKPDTIPGILHDFPLALAKNIQVPFELALINALGTVAVAVQRKIKVKVKPGYYEPLNVYCLCALPPGERKSAAVEACKRPLVEWEMGKRREMRDIIRAAASERKTLEKAIEGKRTKAGNVTDAEARRALIDEIKELEGQLPEVPVAPRLLADDFTPERLAGLMLDHKQRMGVLVAEGGLFDTLAGKYSSGVPNIDAVLKFWGAESCHVDRVSKEAICLDSPHLTLCISPQPEIVRGLADKPGFRGRGLVGRFLYVLPQSLLGYRDGETTPVPEPLIAQWRNTVLGLLELPWALNEHGEEASHVIRLAPDAYRLWTGFAASVESLLIEGREFANMTDWAAKFPGQGIRLAGLFHCATVNEPHRHEISHATMDSALKVAAVLSEHAKAAYSLMGSDPDQECARAILRWIERDRVDSFTARDAFNKVKGRFPTMKQVAPGLAVLVDRAYIFPASTDRTGPGRKPSDLYTVNPYLREV